MIDHFLMCSCGEVIVKSNDITTKVRSKIILFKSDAAFAVCKKCGKEYPIPLMLDKKLLKSQVNRTYLFLNKAK